MNSFYLLFTAGKVPDFVHKIEAFVNLFCYTVQAMGFEASLC